jgi:Fe-S oxidoreductase
MPTRSWLEITVLAVLLAGSAVAFWLRFRVVLRAVLGARPDADFQLRPLAPRVRQFVSEVLLQSKVVRERPLPGLAHALVFWGFCAFAVVSLNHLLEGFGVRWLARDGAARGYFLLVGVLAAAVAVSIAGLAVRRFVARPRWLGEVSIESGVIALLIFILMATYLAAFPYPDSRLNWWLHTLALVVFLPLIPHTKHLHLMLSPVTVFLRRDGFSRIPPLAGDEDLGIEAGKDLTRLAALQAYSCVECGRCTEHCPAYNTGKVLNPKEVILGLRRYLNGPGTGGGEPVLDGYVPLEAVFQCTTCGACEYQCPVGIQHLPLIVGLRRGVVNTGRWEDEYGVKLFTALERNGNSLGFSATDRQKFIEKSGLPLFDGSQEYCLWLGCMGSYDPGGRETALALAKVLRYLGISFGVLSKEKCTGDPARRLGNDYLFQQLAEANMEQFDAAGVKKLVSICPHCVRTIGTDWVEFGASYEIQHHSELLAAHYNRLPRTARTEERVVFHDPCYLGRYRGVYDQPREIAARGGAVVEPPRTRERSRCCGAGGGLMFLGEEKGARVNMDRARELVATGAPTIAAACPFCRTMFRDALDQIGPATPRLVDIAELAALSLER